MKRSFQHVINIKIMKTYCILFFPLTFLNHHSSGCFWHLERISAWAGHISSTRWSCVSTILDIAGLVPAYATQLKLFSDWTPVTSKPNGLFSHTSLLRILFEVSAMWSTFDYPLPEIFSSLELQNLTLSVPSLSLQQCPHGALAALQASVVFLSIYIWTAPKPRLPGWTWLLHSGHIFPATWRTSPST